MTLRSAEGHRSVEGHRSAEMRNRTTNRASRVLGSCSDRLALAIRVPLPPAAIVAAVVEAAALRLLGLLALALVLKAAEQHLDGQSVSQSVTATLLAGSSW